MKPVIAVEHLVKEYKIFKKEEGVFGAIKGLFNRRYEIKRAVNDISFEIGEGELVGFLGANGAGKTTTLKILSGLLYPTSGKVEVLGYVPYERKNEFRKRIAIVLGQKNQLLWDLPAQDSFLLLKEIYEVPDAQYREQLSHLTELLKVKDKLGVQLRRLSLGERMKMEFIGALLHKPKALFLDEPTIGLDVVAQLAIREFIKRYNEESKTTIILTSHYMQDIEALCKRVIIIDGGKIFFDGALSDIVEQFSSEKILTIDFHAPIAREALSEFGAIEWFEGSSAKLRVSRQNISKVSAAILSRFDVQDLTIEEAPIEDIIRRLFIRELAR